MGKSLRLFGCIILLGVLAACAQAPEDGPDPAVVVSEDAQVLDAAGRAALTDFSLDLDTGSGELRFPLGTSGLESVEAGTILVSEPVDGVADYGFLQLVTERRTEGGEIVLATQQATLEDVFEKAEIELNRSFSQADVESMTMHYAGITPASVPNLQARQTDLQAQQTELFDFGWEFDEVLVEGESGTLTVDGSFGLNVTADANINIGLFKLKLFDFIISLEESANLTISGDLDFEFEKEVELVNLDLGVIVIPVGPVPVVFSFQLAIVIGAEGEVTAQLKVEASQEASLSVGARYTDTAGWENLSGFENNFDFPIPEISASARARAYAGGKFTVSIYGLAGPYVYANAFVETDAELFRDPFWTLSAGMEAGLGLALSLPVVGQVANLDFPLAEIKVELDSSDNQAPRLTVLEPTSTVQLGEGNGFALQYRVEDREQRTVEVTVTSDQDGEIFKGEVEGGTDHELFIGMLCPGPHTFTVTATDDGGREDDGQVQADVTPNQPSVSILELDASLPVYEGGFIFASAHAVERTCSSDQNEAEQTLIDWTITGTDFAYTGADLAALLPVDVTAGDVIQLHAEYESARGATATDQTEVTVLELPAELVGEVQAAITRPGAGASFYMAETIELSGMAYVLGSFGQIDGSNLTWEIRRQGQTVWYEIGTGSTASFVPQDLLPTSSYPTQTDTPYELRLSAADGGNTGSVTVIIELSVVN